MMCAMRGRRCSDEVQMGLDYYDASLFETVPVLYAEMASALDAEFPGPEPTQLADLPVVVTVRVVDWRRPGWQSVRHGNDYCRGAGDVAGAGA